MSVIVKSGGGKPEEEKTVTAGTSVIEVNPSSGKVMKKVTVNPTPTESKSVTPTTSELTVTPSVGKHLSQVIVGAVEDVTPEVTAQTPVITQIAEKLGVTITTPSGTNKQILQGNNANLLNINNNAKKEGAYVWKKSLDEIVLLDSVTITASRPTTATMKFESTDIDLSKLTSDTYVDFFNGLSFGTSTSNSITFSKNGSSLVFGYAGATIGYSVAAWDSAEKQLLFAQAFGTSYGVGDNTVKTGTRILVKSVDEPVYIVSDSPTAYPDGGEQKECWYEKVVEAAKNIACGEITLASMATSIDIPHGFPIKPTYLFVMSTTSLADSLTGVAIIPIKCDADNAHVYRGTDMDSTIYHAEIGPIHSYGSIRIPSYSENYPWGAGTYKWMAMY